MEMFGEVHAGTHAVDNDESLRSEEWCQHAVPGAPPAVRPLAGAGEEGQGAARPDGLVRGHDDEKGGRRPAG